MSLHTIPGPLPSRPTEPPEPMNLSLGLDNTHVLITGGSGYIGSAVINAFLSAGARVTSLDIRAPSQLPRIRHSPKKLQHLICDISSESSLFHAWATAVKIFGPVKTCIALASLDYSVLMHHESIVDMSADQWRQTHAVNVEGTFLTAREWVRGLRDVAGGQEQENGGNVGLVIVGSESGRFGETGNADYASGKSAVQIGLVQSLVRDVQNVCAGARVNAVAPGPVDTVQFRQECAQNPAQYYRDAEATVPLKKPVSPESVAKTILFLSSEWAKDITGQVINVDGGKHGKLFWERSGGM